MATLVLGLPDDSRVKKKLSKRKITLTQELLALILDDFNALLWGLSRKTGQKPESVFQKLTKKETDKDEYMCFESADDYEAWRKSKEEQWSCQK